MKNFYADLNSEIKMGVGFVKECPIYASETIMTMLYFDAII